MRPPSPQRSWADGGPDPVPVPENFEPAQSSGPLGTVLRARPRPRGGASPLPHPSRHPSSSPYSVTRTSNHLWRTMMSADNPDLAIAQQATLEPITTIAERAGIPAHALIPYGSYKAKVDVRRMTDRKSTRLNSSHVSISYA